MLAFGCREETVTDHPVWFFVRLKMPIDLVPSVGPAHPSRERGRVSPLRKKRAPPGVAVLRQLHDHGRRGAPVEPRRRQGAPRKRKHRAVDASGGAVMDLDHAGLELNNRVRRYAGMSLKVGAPILADHQPPLAYRLNGGGPERPVSAPCDF